MRSVDTVRISDEAREAARRYERDRRRWDPGAVPPPPVKRGRGPGGLRPVAGRRCGAWPTWRADAALLGLLALLGLALFMVGWAAGPWLERWMN